MSRGWNHFEEGIVDTRLQEENKHHQLPFQFLITGWTSWLKNPGSSYLWSLVMSSKAQCHASMPSRQNPTITLSLPRSCLLHTIIDFTSSTQILGVAMSSAPPTAYSPHLEHFVYHSLWRFTLTMRPNSLFTGCSRYVQYIESSFFGVHRASNLNCENARQYYIKLEEAEKNRKLNELLDALEFNQVR